MHCDGEASNPLLVPASIECATLDELYYLLLAAPNVLAARNEAARYNTYTCYWSSYNHGVVPLLV
jgi:hypothetical protein